MRKFEDMINTIQLGDCYEMIKKIPDKSIDLIYVDIPYLYFNSGKGRSELANRMSKKRNQLSNIDKGIDYSILDEFIRICKNPYIYIYGAVSCRY